MGQRKAHGYSKRSFMESGNPFCFVTSEGMKNSIMVIFFC